MTLDEIAERLSVIIKLLTGPYEGDGGEEFYVKAISETCDLHADVSSAMFDLMTDEEREQCRQRTNQFFDDGEDVPF